MGPWRVAGAVALCISCTGTTGYELVTFKAAARGAADAVKGQPYTFTLDGPQRVTLTKAILHVGALYLTKSVPTSGGGPAPCVLPGTVDGVFVGEVRDATGDGIDVDMLDPSLQPIPIEGRGSTVPAATGQVWLTHGNVNAATEAPILTIEGVVVVAGVARTFSADLAIDSQTCSPATGAASSNSALPGESQICEARIVQGVPAGLTLASGGTLVLDVDPKALFVNARLDRLPAFSGCPTDGCFTCRGAYNPPSGDLFANLKSTGPYRFEWIP